ALVQGWVAELLAAPMNHDDEEVFETDPKKRERARSDADLKDRWRQQLELEVLTAVAMMDQRAADLAKGDAGKSGKDKKGKKKVDVPAQPTRPLTDDDGTPELTAAQIPPTAEGREAKARADLAKRYAGRFARLAQPKPIASAAMMVNAVTGTFDPHTDYLPPPDKANFDQAIKGHLEGIGALLREDDQYIRVIEIVPGGAAWRQGETQRWLVREFRTMMGNLSSPRAIAFCESHLRSVSSCCSCSSRALATSASAGSVRSRRPSPSAAPETRRRSRSSSGLRSRQVSSPPRARRS
ncbi:MAG TPA: hypothetical protein PLF26_05470, partial [Blastocatellia bacterium]|nr:hypothetical protein [Blastocatellia bacterium]